MKHKTPFSVKLEAIYDIIIIQFKMNVTFDLCCFTRLVRSYKTIANDNIHIHFLRTNKFRIDIGYILFHTQILRYYCTICFKSLKEIM